MITALAMGLLFATRTLTLDEAVASAVTTEPGMDARAVAEEQARLTSLRAQLERVRLTIDARVQEIYDRRNILGKGESSDFVLGLSSVQAQLDVPLFTGFRITHGVARAEALERAATFDREALRRDVGIAVARAYLSARRLDALARTQRATLERLLEQHRLIDARVASGLAPAIDAARAKAQRLEALADIEALDADARVAALEVALLANIDEEVELVDVVLPVEVPPLSALLDDAKDALPSLRAVRARMLAQSHAVDVARSSFYPQLGAFSLAQYGNNPQLAGAGVRAVASTANPFAPLAGDLQVGVALTFNIFDTLNTLHTVQQAEMQERALSADERSQLQEVERTVRRAHERWSTLQARRPLVVEKAALTRQNLKLLEHRYEDGELLLTELLAATLDVLGDERRVVDLDAQIAQAKAELLLLAGKDLHT